MGLRRPNPSFSRPSGSWKMRPEASRNHVSIAATVLQRISFRRRGFLSQTRLISAGPFPGVAEFRVVRQLDDVDCGQQLDDNVLRRLARDAIEPAPVARNQLGRDLLWDPTNGSWDCGVSDFEASSLAARRRIAGCSADAVLLAAVCVRDAVLDDRVSSVRGNQKQVTIFDGADRRRRLVLVSCVSQIATLVKPALCRAGALRGRVRVVCRSVSRHGVAVAIVAPRPGRGIFGSKRAANLGAA